MVQLNPVGSLIDDTVLNAHIADTDIHFSDAPADAQDYVRNNNAWVVAAAGVTDHGALTGLGDDDHPQYGLLASPETVIGLWQFNDAVRLRYGVAAADTPGVGQIFAGGDDIFFRDDNGVVTSMINAGGISDHTLLTNIGVNTHAQLDLAVTALTNHVADATIHFTEGNIDHTAIQNIGVNTHAQIDTHIADATLHFTVGSISHTAITNIGVNTHAQIDTHLADATIHFTEASIDHTAIANIGSNSHASIDTHISDGTIHFTEASIDHGSIAGLADDDHTQYVLDGIGRATPQSVIGGLAAGNELVLQGSSAADRGRVVARGGITIDWDFSTDSVTSGAILIQSTIPSSGGLIAANITIANNITIDNALFIMSALDDNSTLTFDVAPGFAVTTLFFARQNYRSNTPGVAPAQAYIYAAQCQYWLTGAGDVTTSNYRGVSFAPIIRVDNSGDDMRITNTTGLHVGPLYNTRNANSTADFGTIRGVHMVSASGILFGQSLGAEIATDWVGLDMENVSNLAVSGVKAAVRSQLVNSGLTNYCILNTSSAPSSFGLGRIWVADNTGVNFGNTLAAPDVLTYWASGGGAYAIQFPGTFNQNILFSNPVSGQILVSGGTNELTINTTAGFSLGAQTGTLGNSFGQFVAGTRSTGVGGEWSDFILTQAANITADHAMGLVAGWTINAPSITLGTGTVTTAGALNIGGNVNQGSVNRFGVRILSNPSGGSGINAALWVTAGRAQFDGIVTLPRNTDANRGAAGEAGRVIFNTDDGQMNIDDGTNWTLPDGSVT